VAISSGIPIDVGITLGIAAAGIWGATLSSSVIAVLQERQGRTLQLLATTPSALVWPLFGRVVGAAIQSTVAAPLSVLAVSVIWRPPRLGNPALAAGSLLLVILGSTAMSAFFVGFLVRYRFFAGMINGFEDLTALLCGMFVPVATLAPIGRGVAWMLPPTWGMITVRDQSFTALAVGTLVVLCWFVLATICLISAERRVRRTPSAFFV